MFSVFGMCRLVSVRLRGDCSERAKRVEVAVPGSRPPF